MKFYDFQPAPSPRRVRIFLAEKGILNEVDSIEVDLRKKEQMTEEFARINPALTVPVLELNDGTRLGNTAAIFRYLEETNPEPPLMGSTPLEKALIAQAQWQIEQDGFSAIAECLRNQSTAMEDRAITGKYNYPQIPALAERGKLRAERFMESLDNIIGAKPFVAGDTFSIADIDALVYIDFAKWVKVTIPDNAANLKRWFESVSQRPSAKL